MATEIRVASGYELEPYIPAVAELRISVFREFPYLYDGDDEYERRYLARYSDSPNSVLVLALEGNRVIGASTGIPLEEADEAFQAPIDAAADLDPKDVFYFAESVLLTPYRGQGIGHAFFDERERHAEAMGYSITAFCAVDRPDDDPRKPEGYRPLDAFWRRRGYEHRPDLVAYYSWQDLDEDEETPKRMTYWIRRT